MHVSVYVAPFVKYSHIYTIKLSKVSSLWSQYKHILQFLSYIPLWQTIRQNPSSSMYDHIMALGMLVCKCWQTAKGVLFGIIMWLYALYIFLWPQAWMTGGRSIFVGLGKVSYRFVVPSSTFEFRISNQLLIRHWNRTRSEYVLNKW